jgi:hypothetical protein
LSEKIKELHKFKREGKLEKYDSETLQTKSRLVQSILDSNKSVDVKDDLQLNLLYKHYLKEEFKSLENPDPSVIIPKSERFSQNFVDKGIACSLKMP